MPNIILGTLNIGKGATKFLDTNYSKQDVEDNLRLIANLINRHAIDVIGLQEVDVNTNRNRKVDEPTFLRDELNWPIRGSRFESAIEFDDGYFGNAILMNVSKEELTYQDSKIQRKKFTKLFGREDRSAIAIRIDIKQPTSSSRTFKNLWFVTTHLDNPFCDWTNQLCQILSWTDGFSFPVIICGDFNVPERAEGLKTVEYQLLKEMFDKYGFIDLGPFDDVNFTFPRRATKKVDFMFLRDNRKWFDIDNIERIRPKIDDVWLTDHWAIVCSLSY